MSRLIEFCGRMMESPQCTHERHDHQHPMDPLRRIPHPSFIAIRSTAISAVKVFIPSSHTIHATERRFTPQKHPPSSIQQQSLIRPCIQGFGATSSSKSPAPSPSPSRFRGPPNSQRRKRDNQKPQHGLSHDPGCFGTTKETISVNDDQHGKKDHQPQQKQHTCKTDPFR